MNDSPLPSSRLGMIIGFFVLSIFSVGCGAVGPPIPPEDVGIEAKVRKQQRATAIDHDATLEDPAAVIEEEAVELPALYPIGTR